MPSFKRAHEIESSDNFQPSASAPDAPTAAVGAYLRANSGSGDHGFQIDSRVSEMIGLADLKKSEEKKAFDGEVFRYVQKIKDGAFQEAYDKGLAEGTEKAKKDAFDSLKADYEKQLLALNTLVLNLTNIAEKAYQEQEAELVAFSYLMAKKVIYKEIEKDPTLFAHAIKNILREHEAQKDKTVFKISQVDYDFLQAYAASISAQVDINKLKIVADEKLSQGDVVMENALGTVDGKLATRLEKLQQLFEAPE